jgi:hypothetical protein
MRTLPLALVLLLALLHFAPTFASAEEALLHDDAEDFGEEEDEGFYEDLDPEDILIEDIADHGVGRSKRAPHHAHRDQAEWLDEQQPPAQHTKRHMDDFVRDIRAAADRSALRERLRQLEKEAAQRRQEESTKQHGRHTERIHNIERAQQLLFDAMRAEQQAHEAYNRVKVLQDQATNRNQHPLWHNPQKVGVESKNQYQYYDRHNPVDGRRP